MTMSLSQDARPALPSDGGLNRRDLIKLGAGATAAGVLASPSLAWARATPLPHRRLPASAAERVVSSQFVSSKQLKAWGAEVDKLGLRATGSAVHERYVRTLAKRLRRMGLHDVRLEGVDHDRWLATGWSLTVAGRQLHHTFYVPYSKPTGPSGLTADMVYVGSMSDVANVVQTVDVRGKIAVFDVSYTELSLRTFEA